ncbi:MAG: glycosyltransferase family 4 protein [Desulfobacterales bacterium]|nr:MAG: glycosyltransferase family 4 protein [Desulfobacterales bacterium]
MTESERLAVARGIDMARGNGVRIEMIPSLVRRISLMNDLHALWSLVRLILKEKPDIVHTHTSKAGFLGRLSAKIAKAGFIVHTPHGHVFYGHFGRWRSRFFLWIEKLFASFTHRLVALTDGEMNDYIALKVCPTGKLQKIHSGVDIAKFKTVQVDTVEKKRTLGLGQNGAVVGFIGWLLPIKGPMHLLKAMEVVWQDVPDVQLVFIGKGDLDIDLRTAALNGSGNGRVKFLGWRDDVDEIIPVFDILALPSLNEGMGRVLVEAMAAGKPLVASNVGGIPDLVQHNENGLLVPPADEKALAAAIMQLINEPEKATLMGRRGQELCEQFSIEKMVEKIDNLYQELLKSHHPLQDLHCKLPTDKVLENQVTQREKSQPSDQDVKINT